jgi:hypothetical protein
MPKSQINPVNIIAWSTPTTIITGGVNGTVIDQVIINNSSNTSSGAITTKVNVNIVLTAGSPTIGNQVLSGKSIFRQKNYELKELEGIFLSTGTKLIVEAVPGVVGTSALPSLVVAGSYENL